MKFTGTPALFVLKATLHRPLHAELLVFSIKTTSINLSLHSFDRLLFNNGISCKNRHAFPELATVRPSVPNIHKSIGRERESIDPCLICPLPANGEQSSVQADSNYPIPLPHTHTHTSANPGFVYETVTWQLQTHLNFRAITMRNCSFLSDNGFQLHWPNSFFSWPHTNRKTGNHRKEASLRPPTLSLYFCLPPAEFSIEILYN